MSIKAKEVRKLLGKNILADGFEPILDLENSHDSWIVDQRDGSEYLDMFSMYASGCIGYNHPQILKNKDLLAKVSLFKPTLSDIYTTEYADFVNIFNQVAIPDYLKNTFFIEGGSLAVENALKVAFDWKVRKNLISGIENKGYKILHFKEAFHGRSGYTLSLTNTDPIKTKYFPKFDWPRIDNPHLTFPITDDVIKNVQHKEKESLKQITDALKNNPNDIAALIIEPIQGEGGDNHFRDEFFKKLKELSLEHDFLLIYDEIQTGIGITGNMWAHEHFADCKPDIISFGKKTQVCGMLAGNKIYDLEDNVFKESSRINSTFGGNLVDMYRFKLILEIISQENLFSNAQKMGDYLLKHIHELTNEFPGYVTNPRGKGLFCAFDLPSGIERDKLINILLDEKLIILGSGDNSIRFRPHLNVIKEDIDVAITKIADAIKLMLN